MKILDKTNNERKKIEQKLTSHEKKKMDGLKLFQFLYQFIMDNFFIKLTQLKKSGSKDKISVSNNFHFQVDNLSCDLYTIVDFAFF